MTVKKTGCCTLCDTEVYEVITYFPEGPLYRFPRKIGKPLPSKVSIDYVLADGSHSTLTSCTSCASQMIDPANFPAIWRKVVRTFMFEEQDDVRAALPAPQRSQAEKARILADITALANNPPLGVISRS